MLCQFSFQNFKCFKREAFLDYMAEPIKENTDSLILDDSGEILLPVIAIYGPNGGGKSTVLKALGFLCSYLLKHEEHHRAEKLYHRFDPGCKELPTSFDLLFHVSNRTYRYQLSILSETIEEENLYIQESGCEPFIVFERTAEHSYKGCLPDEISLHEVPASVPLLSYLSANHSVPEISEAVSWFQKIQFIECDGPAQASDYLVYQMLLQDSKRRRSLFSLLQKMDINISGIRIDGGGAWIKACNARTGAIDSRTAAIGLNTKSGDSGASNAGPSLFVRHTLPNGTVAELPFEEESSGTKKLIHSLIKLLDCLENGGLIAADDLDAILHTKLLCRIIGLFTDPKVNRKGAQLLFTAHDTAAMNTQILRRDEIWFCALNPEHASTLYSLISFRNEFGRPAPASAFYGARYLEGRYGADPCIGEGWTWGANDEC